MIDTHAHLVDPSALERMAAVSATWAPTLRHEAASWFIELPVGIEGGRRSVPIPAGLVNVEARLREMDRQGISSQLLRNFSALDFDDAPPDTAAELHSIHNDGIIATVRGWPLRFGALPSLPGRAPALAVREVQRLAVLPEVVGFGIGTTLGGMELDDIALTPVWEAIDDTRLPVVIHPLGTEACGGRLQPYFLTNVVGNPLETAIAVARVLCSGLLDRYPRLRFAFAHGGGYLPYQVGRLDHAWRVRPEVRARTTRPPSEYLRSRCWFDSLTHSPDALRFLGELVGWDHVVLASDYPWDMGTPEPVLSLREAGLGPDMVARVGSTNARSLFRLSNGLRADHHDAQDGGARRSDVSGAVASHLGEEER